MTLFERQIVRHLKEPALEIRRGAAEREMPEERQEDVLHDVLRRCAAEIERRHVTPESRRTVVEHREDPVLDRQRPRASIWCQCRWKCQLDHVLKLRSRHRNAGILYAWSHARHA